MKFGRKTGAQGDNEAATPGSKPDDPAADPNAAAGGKAAHGKTGARGQRSEAEGSLRASAGRIDILPSRPPAGPAGAAQAEQPARLPQRADADRHAVDG
jgi:hypothetical protein